MSVHELIENSLDDLLFILSFGFANLFILLGELVPPFTGLFHGSVSLLLDNFWDIFMHLKVKTFLLLLNYL